jgi:aspartyl-tRNA(Asn)/glutamyl-tRNA(Gln) amidotransferase subunit C
MLKGVLSSGKVVVMDEETVRKVAKVARLKLTDAEMQQYAADLEDILSAFSVLDEAPAIEDFDLGPIKVEDVLRDDEVCRDSDPAELREVMGTKDDRVRGPRLS